MVIKINFTGLPCRETNPQADGTYLSDQFLSYPILSKSSLVPRPFWEGETAWQHPPVQTVYGRNVTAIAYLIQSVKST